LSAGDSGRKIGANTREIDGHPVAFTGIFGLVWNSRRRFQVGTGEACFRGFLESAEKANMRGSRYDRILAGTALALVMALTPAAYAQPDLLDSKMPLPQQAPLPPPTAADVTGTAVTPGSVAPGSVTPGNPEAAPTENAAPEKPDPLASLDPADRPIAEKMRDHLNAKVDRIFPNRKERAVVETFYQNRNLAPLWFERGVVNARAKAAIERLSVADADGLDLKDYKLPSFDAVGADAQAEAEDIVRRPRLLVGPPRTRGDKQRRTRK